MAPTVPFYLRGAFLVSESIFSLLQIFSCTNRYQSFFHWHNECLCLFNIVWQLGSQTTTPFSWNTNAYLVLNGICIILAFGAASGMFYKLNILLHASSKLESFTPEYLFRTHVAIFVFASLFPVTAVSGTIMTDSMKWNAFKHLGTLIVFLFHLPILLYLLYRVRLYVKKLTRNARSSKSNNSLMDNKSKGSEVSLNLKRSVSAKWQKGTSSIPRNISRNVSPASADNEISHNHAIDRKGSFTRARCPSLHTRRSSVRERAMSGIRPETTYQETHTAPEPVSTAAESKRFFTRNRASSYRGSRINSHLQEKTNAHVVEKVSIAQSIISPHFATIKSNSTKDLHASPHVTPIKSDSMRDLHITPHVAAIKSNSTRDLHTSSRMVPIYMKGANAYFSTSTKDINAGATQFRSPKKKRDISLEIKNLMWRMKMIMFVAPPLCILGSLLSIYYSVRQFRLKQAYSSTHPDPPTLTVEAGYWTYIFIIAISQYFHKLRLSDRIMYFINCAYCVCNTTATPAGNGDSGKQLEMIEIMLKSGKEGTRRNRGTSAPMRLQV